VTDREDPDKMGRVRCTTAALGTQQTNWLYRVVPMPSLSPPVPDLGDTVAILYVEGDPHNGCYLGCLQNNLNPARDKDTLWLEVGDTSVTVERDRLQLKLREQTLTMDKRGIDIQATDVSINGKKVMVVGGQDSDGDIMTTPGY
jgi:hypothetical protein